MTDRKPDFILFQRNGIPVLRWKCKPGYKNNEGCRVSATQKQADENAGKMESYRNMRPYKVRLWKRCEKYIERVRVLDEIKREEYERLKSE